MVALGELNSYHVPVLLRNTLSMTARLSSDTNHVLSDMFRQHLQSIELPLNSFLLSDTLESRIETFSKQ